MSVYEVVTSTQRTYLCHIIFTRAMFGISTVGSRYFWYWYTTVQFTD